MIITNIIYCAVLSARPMAWHRVHNTQRHVAFLAEECLPNLHLKYENWLTAIWTWAHNVPTGWTQDLTWLELLRTFFFSVPPKRFHQGFGGFVKRTIHCTSARASWQDTHTKYASEIGAKIGSSSRCVIRSLMFSILSLWYAIIILLSQSFKLDFAFVISLGKVTQFLA